MGVLTWRKQGAIRVVQRAAVVQLPHLDTVLAALDSERVAALHTHQHRRTELDGGALLRDHRVHPATEPVTPLQNDDIVALVRQRSGAAHTCKASSHHKDFELSIDRVLGLKLCAPLARRHHLVRKAWPTMLAPWALQCLLGLAPSTASELWLWRRELDLLLLLRFLLLLLRFLLLLLLLPILCLNATKRRRRTPSVLCRGQRFCGRHPVSLGRARRHGGDLFDFFRGEVGGICGSRFRYKSASWQ